MWLELTRAEGVTGEEQTVWINFDMVPQLDWLPKRSVTALFLSSGYRTEVKETPEQIFRAMQDNTRMHFAPVFAEDNTRNIGDRLERSIQETMRIDHLGRD
jgi:hypothetical protein